MKARSWRDWAILAAAAWLGVSPFVLGFADAALLPAWSAWFSALVLFASAFEAFAVSSLFDEWVEGAVGLWLVANPWLLDYNHQVPIAADFVAVGLVVSACALSALARGFRSRFAAARIPR